MKLNIIGGNLKMVGGRGKLLLELEKWHTISELEKIKDEYWSYIKSSEELVKLARLKKRSILSKIMIEEISPLLVFAKLHYEGEIVTCRYTGQKTQKTNNKFDGEIRRVNGLIERIEIATTLNGFVEHEEAKELNERGISKIVIGDGSEKQAIVENILRIVRKKATKPYEGVILVFKLEQWFPYINFPGWDEFIQSIIEEMSKITYTAKEVYLLIPEIIQNPYSECLSKGSLYRIR